MATILYPDFMENTAAYDAAESMWKEMLDALATEHDFSHAPYLNTRLSNGEKERDANPIFNTYVASLNRAIRILQITQEEVGDLHISGWVDTFELEADQPPIHELVISLVLSEEAKAIAEQFIHAWLVEQVDEESMDRLVEERMILAEE